LRNGTYDSSRQDEYSNDKHNDHENVVKSSDSTIKISHGSFETESFSVNTENGGLDFISSRITVAVFVEDFERDLRSLEVREAVDQ
jgi:hypothetical protein